MALFRAFRRVFIIVVIFGIIGECSIGGSFYMTSLIIDELVAGNTKQGIHYSLIFAGFIILTLFFRHKSQEINGRLFV